MMDGDGDSGSASESGVAVTIQVRCSNGSKFQVQTSLDVTIAAFKVLLADLSEVPVEQQRLIYKGRILKDDHTLQSYGLQDDHTVHLVGGAVRASTNVSSSPSTEAPNNMPAQTRGLAALDSGAFGGASIGGSLFTGPGSLNGLGGTGAAGLFGSGLPEFEQVQQQLTQNPNIMRDIMNMPVIQNLMNNPDLMRNLIMSNPQMREIIDRNPDLAHILNDPSTLRQTLEAARNPELMREMMRNTDRAMSNIESSPEGFNMLRRMYETVQEPFLNATTMAGDNANDLASNPFAALLRGARANRDQTPNTNSTTTASEGAAGSPAPNTNPLPNPWSSAAGNVQTIASTRSVNPTDGARPGGPGVGGFGLPEVERMLGSLQESPLTNQVMQSPAMLQILQGVLSNPQYMNQILNLNPQLRGMLESNPQFREMLQNPEFIRQMTSPEMMQQVLALQQSLLSGLGRQQLAEEQGQTGATTGNVGLELLMNMFGGLGAGGLAVPHQPDVPPEQLYARQLSQLQEMGFIDTQENIQALSATAGNVHAAVDRLLGNLGQ